MTITDEKNIQIDHLVKTTLKKAKIPGLSLVIVNGNSDITFKNFGYRDIAAKEPVTSDTFFELGSNSKAFTALLFLDYIRRGLIQQEDPVQKYLPWFRVNYKGEAAVIKIRDLLYHTSGIPFHTIKNFREDQSALALGKSVKTLTGIELDYLPGEKYQYATINYDILGLILSTLSGKSYEETVKNELLDPLHLSSTYLSRNDIELSKQPIGYKISFLRSVKQVAPFYRGNLPAGYFISNARDIARWMEIQLGIVDDFTFNKEVIAVSHIPDRTVMPGEDGGSYAAGWLVYQKGSGEISHGGNNPNFSSFIALRPEEKIGVAVLANLNSSYTAWLGQNICNILLDKKLSESGQDIYKSLDQFSSVILILLIPLALLILIFIGLFILDMIKKKRPFSSTFIKSAAAFITLLIFFAGIAFCLYRIPYALFWGLDWNFVRIWSPSTFIPAVILIWGCSFLFGIYFLLTVLFPKKDDRSLFSLIILSIVSGLGNAFIIFMVNEALSRDGGFQGELFIYFVMGIIVYILGQKLVRTRLIKIANEMVYQKRTEIIHKILNTSFQKIDAIEYGKIQASLNNDTETVSEFTHIIITGATSLVTLIACFVYMGAISIAGLIVTIFVIILAAGLHFLIGQRANQLWEETRDIQNIFFKFIHDLTSGFKELTLHRGKNRDFKEDMSNSCKEYRDKRVQGDMKYANANVIGELLFTFVIGVVAFIFPVIFKNIKVEMLQTYVFILLYMTGPVHGILGAIPNIFRVKISWKRINDLLTTLDEMDRPEEKNITAEKNKTLQVELKEVEFHYKESTESTFKIGPVSKQFKSGEITFITGGNGSGKSTLAKLVTGLYTPDKGEIYINGEKVDSRELGQKYSTVFSDFHLFEKLYGIDHTEKIEEISKYLEILELKDKVTVNAGVLNTLKLSTGQRKRLALLVSYLEDREIYLFDEWAADQDPEFRKFFYHELLPGLKARGKCVIAITHDDRYFNLADQMIKMELGKIV